MSGGHGILTDMAAMQKDLRCLRWMVGVNTVILVMIIGRLF